MRGRYLRTTYARLGFRNKRLQLVKDDHPPVRQAKERALKLGRSEADICHRMMVFDVYEARVSHVNPATEQILA